MLPQTAELLPARPAPVRAVPRLDIVALPDTPWDRIVWTNRQHVMLRLAASSPGIRVLYVAPPRFFGRGLAAGEAGPSLWTTCVAERLWVVQPLLPLPNRVLRRSGLLDRLMISAARRAARRLGFEAPCVWSYTPAYAEHVGAFGESRLVYDVVDDYSALPHYRRTLGRDVERLDRSLTERADTVFVIADHLLERRRRWNTSCHLVGNGADVELFAGARSAPEAAELAWLPRPRIGFHGTLSSDKLDLPLLTELARRRPDWSFVLVGPEADSGTRRALGGLPNVHLLGSRAAAELPACLAGFDVVLVPYRQTTYTARPLKVYEALAAGVPVVTTGLDELRHLAGVTTAVPSAAGVEGAVEQVLAAPTAPVPLADLDELSWEAKARRMLAHLDVAVTGAGV